MHGGASRHPDQLGAGNFFRRRRRRDDDERRAETWDLGLCCTYKELELPVARDAGPLWAMSSRLKNLDLS